MSRSLNEIRAICRQASRGAGLSWGLAEEAGKGAGWLSALGLEGPRLLAVRLGALDGIAPTDLAPVSLTDDWYGPRDRLCPLVAGAALSDLAGRLADDRSIVMNGVSCPLLIAPFAGEAARQIERPVTVEWGDLKLTTYGRRLSVEGARERLDDEHCRRLRCRVVRSMPAFVLSPAVRGRVDEETWTRLAGFAARTYAPATDESRRRGAGEGGGD